MSIRRVFPIRAAASAGSESAAAAKETADLIETSVDNVKKGTEIAQMTGDSLNKVGEPFGLAMKLNG